MYDREQPGIVIFGKQSIDGDNGQTGQMFAALTGLPQGTFASRLSVTDGKAEVVREVDGGLQTVTLSLPAVVTTDLRLNEPRYASLPNIMRAKRKPLDTTTPEELGVDAAPRFEVVNVEPPPGPQRRHQGGERRRTGGKTQKRSKGDRMSVLVVAEHDNRVLRPVTLNVLAAASEIGGDIDVLVAGSACAEVAQSVAAVGGVSRVLCADAPAYAHQLAENLAPLVVEVGASYEHILAAHTTTGKNFLPRVAAAVRCGDDLGHHRRRRGRHLQTADLRRQRHRHSQIQRREKSPVRARNGF